MNSTEFKAIEQYDVIEIYSKDGAREGSVLKDSDNRVLVSGIYKTLIRRREKGFYQTVGPADVIRIVKQYSFPVPGSDNSEAVKMKLNGAIELIEDASDLV